MMNRTQRRALMRAQKRKDRMSHEASSLPSHITMEHGHTETHVIVKFNRPIDHVLLTPAEVDALVNAVLRSKQMLEQFQAAKAPHVEH